MDEPRIPPLPVDERDERTTQLLASLGVRRPEGDDLRLFTTLARHPKLLKRWSDFGGYLLVGGRLGPRDRELLILRTGWNCGSDYEWGQHVDIGRGVGITDDEIAALARPVDEGDWSEGERWLLVAADELHDANCIGDSTWAALAERYDDQQLIEICMVVGQYHLVAFTLRSLKVQREPGVVGFPD
jgi:alkylhydroperoxidase family enzyme